MKRPGGLPVVSDIAIAAYIESEVNHDGSRVNEDRVPSSQ